MGLAGKLMVSRRWDRARVSCKTFVLGSKQGGHSRERLLWRFAPKRAELRAFPACTDHGPAMMVKEECGGQTHKLEGTVGSHPVPKARLQGPRVLLKGEQSPAQPSVPAANRAAYISIGSFGQIITVQTTSLPLPLTLVAFKRATRRSKPLYPITSLLSHICPLASHIILKWQLNGKEVALPIRRQ